MIDLHSHILPNIDDGARSMADTLALAQHSVDIGVTHMMCTPHWHLGRYDNHVNDVQSVFDETVRQLHANHIPLKLALGAEIRMCTEIVQWAQQASLPVIGQWQSKPAFLLEMSHSHIPAGIENLLMWLKQHRTQAIIVHPERNRDILKYPEKIKRLHDAGAIFQGTAGSFTDTFKSDVQKVTWQLLEEGYFAYVASDMHDLNRRYNQMAECRDLIAQHVGAEQAQALTLTVPQSITQSVNWL